MRDYISKYFKLGRVSSNFFLVILSVPVMLFSCSSSSDPLHQFTTVVIDSDQVDDFYELDFIKNDIEIHYLMNDSELLIGNVQHMDFLGSNIVLFDNSAHQILIFNSSYELIKRVESKGEGPGEFKYLECFFVDEEKEEIVIFDSRLLKFLTYDAKGEFIKEKKVNYFARDLFKVGNKWLINNAWSDDKSNPYQIFITNENFEIISKLKPQNKSIVSSIANATPFKKIDSNILTYLEPLSDTVYQLNSALDNLEPLILFDFRDLKYPDELLLDKSARQFFSEISKGRYNGWVRDLWKSGDEMLFQFLETNGLGKMQTVMALYQEEKLSLFSKFTICGGLAVFYPKMVNEGKYFSIISSEELNHYIENNDMRNVHPRLLSLFQKLNNNESTLIISFKL